jgi:hypothetical protein
MAAALWSLQGLSGVSWEVFQDQYPPLTWNLPRCDPFLSHWFKHWHQSHDQQQASSCMVVLKIWMLLLTLFQLQLRFQLYPQMHALLPLLMPLLLHPCMLMTSTVHIITCTLTIRWCTIKEVECTLKEAAHIKPCLMTSNHCIDTVSYLLLL